jgi:hypothetical protein
LTSTVWRSSRSSRTTSMSTGVEKNSEAILCDSRSQRWRSGSLARGSRTWPRCLVIPRKAAVNTLQLEHKFK